MDIDENEQFDEIGEAAAAATYELLPKKSRSRYEQVFKNFESWLEKKNVRIISEDVILAYLFEKSKILKSSSLWSNYSMLKSTLLINKNVDISKYPKVVSFLKRQSVGYKAKKSKVLTKEEVDKFMEEADNNNYLLIKVC